MWAELRRLIRAWWSDDRIRVSPREGRLLRLEPGDVVVVRGCAAEIRARTERRELVPPRVCYDCARSTGTARLTVLAESGACGTVEWVTDDAAEPRDPEAIEPFEVEVFPRAKTVHGPIGQPRN